MSSYEAIELSVGDDGVARLTLNRPDARNAMSQQLSDARARIVHGGSLHDARIGR